MIIHPVIYGEVTDSIAEAFGLGRTRALAFEGSYHKECIEYLGVTIHVDVRDYVAYVILIPSLTGYIFRPRSGVVENAPYYTFELDSFGEQYSITNQAKAVKGGWQDGSVELTDLRIFPTALSPVNCSAIKQEVDIIEFDQPGLYGNMYWCNLAESAEDFKAVSWFGPPSRHGRVPSNYQIPGFSIVERSVSTVADYKYDFTVFNTSLYQNGNVLYSTPSYNWPSGNELTRSLLLGAAIDSFDRVIIVTQNDHQNAPDYYYMMSDGISMFGTEADASTYLLAHPSVSITKTISIAKPGYYIGLWCDTEVPNSLFVDGWWMVPIDGGADKGFTRNGLPWFGNISGTEFVCSNGDKLILTITGDQITGASYTSFTQATGNSTYTTIGSGLVPLPVFENSLSVSGLRYFWEYSNTGSIVSVASLSFTSSSTKRSGSFVEQESYGSFTPPNRQGVDYLTKSTIDSYQWSAACVDPASPHNEWEFSPPWDPDLSGTACIYYDEPPTTPNAGETRCYINRRDWFLWTGDFPGTDHEIHTDYTITIAGINIPIVKTDRTWFNEYGVHSSGLAKDLKLMYHHIVEQCVITTSKIYFLDQRYGVCLYASTTETINASRNIPESTVLTTQYTDPSEFNICSLTVDDYTSTLEEKWYLIVNGVKTEVASTTVDLLPFGEPRGSAVPEDEGKVILLVAPLPGANYPVVGSTDSIVRMGCYEDGYYDGGEISEQVIDDGGDDYYYPSWCRILTEDPFWKQAAAARVAYYTQSVLPIGSSSYEAPAILVEPMPVGSFAKFPGLDSLYQFLITKFDGTVAVVGSASLTAQIDAQLALAKNADGSSKGLVTHDTTLLFPISVI